MSIAIVIPSIREACWKTFVDAWRSLIRKHDATLITVWDGDKPMLQNEGAEYSVKDIMGRDASLIFNKNDGVRNLGFAYIAKYLPEVDIVLTLDDDTTPVNDTIRDHLMALEGRVPVSWISTATRYMRGFPYCVRDEAEVVLSHGVWEGVKDYDAPTQLVQGNPEVEFYQGPIPKGVYFPFCGMNIAFKRKMIPYMYYAPMGYRVGMDRFADIWCGIESKRVIDEKGWAVVSGYAKVQHDRASNVYKNLQKEALGIELNEGFWKGIEEHPYFKQYAQKRARWEAWCNRYL